MRGSHDPAVPVPGRQTKAAQLQQAGLGDPQRVLLLAPGQPLPQRGGQGGAGQEVWHNCFTGTVHLTVMTSGN